jgi:hypothetical protein
LYSELRFGRYEFYKIKTFAAIFGKTETGSGTFLTDRFADGRGHAVRLELQKIGDLLQQTRIRTQDLSMG